MAKYNTREGIVCSKDFPLFLIGFGGEVQCAGDFLFKGIAFVFNRFWWWGTIPGGGGCSKDLPLFSIGFGSGVQYPGELGYFLFKGIAFVFNRFCGWVQYLGVIMFRSLKKASYVE